MSLRVVFGEAQKLSPGSRGSIRNSDCPGCQSRSNMSSSGLYTHSTGNTEATGEQLQMVGGQVFSLISRHPEHKVLRSC